IDLEDNSTESIEAYKNNNRIPNVSNLTSEETQMAKNVLEIRTANYSSEMNKGLATSTQPPTHPLFRYQHPSKAKSTNLQFESNLFSTPNPYLSFPIYNPLQAFSQSYSGSNISEQTLQTSNSTIPTIKDFLKQVDESEDTGEYYQNLLEGLKQQRVSVQLLSLLSDEDFKECEITTVGDRLTLCNYAKKYNRFI
ncbi:26695_t:CDS:2, partial [Gigaspora margarita]